MHQLVVETLVSLLDFGGSMFSLNFITYFLSFWESGLLYEYLFKMIAPVVQSLKLPN